MRRAVLPAAIGVLAVAVAGTGAAASTGLVPTSSGRSAPVAAAGHHHPTASPHSSPHSSPSVRHTGHSTGGPAGPTWVGPQAGAAPGTGQPVTQTEHPSVATLKHLTPPDVALGLSQPATSAQLDRLRHADGVRATAVLDAGKVRTRAGKLDAVGADPSDVRGFTPKLTAKSDKLWASQARGELALSFSLARKLKNKLGKSFAVTGPGNRRTLRLGAFASLGLPHADAMVSHKRAHQLGLAGRRLVLVSAPHASVSTLKSLASDTFGAGTDISVLRPRKIDQSQISSLARSKIPAKYLKLYRQAATTCPGLPWEVLAAIGTVETGNGADTSTSSAGAMGPMQFLPQTFRRYGVDASGDGVADINNPQDAIFSAAHYLCASGAGRGGRSLEDAIFAYNHAWWYVKEVVQIAQRYQ